MIEIAGLCRNFGDRQALVDIDVSLPEGCTLVVLGPNGAGKTTLLRILATLLTPTAGRVKAMGCTLPNEAQALRPQVGLVGHEPLLYRELSALENLRFYGTLCGVTQLDERCRELLRAVGMGARANEPVRDLSRGMLQRVAVCRALLASPKLLLLDEPRSHLDPAAMEAIEPLVGRSAGLTRVLVTHEVDWGLAEADFVLGLREGRALLSGPADKIGSFEAQAVYRRHGGAEGARS